MHLNALTPNYSIIFNNCNYIYYTYTTYSFQRRYSLRQQKPGVFYLWFQFHFFSSCLHICLSLCLEGYWGTAMCIHYFTCSCTTFLHWWVFFENSEWLTLPVLHGNGMFPENYILKLQMSFFSCKYVLCSSKKIETNISPDLWLSLKLNFV